MKFQVQHTPTQPHSSTRLGDERADNGGSSARPNNSRCCRSACSATSIDVDHAPRAVHHHHHHRRRRRARSNAGEFFDLMPAPPPSLPTLPTSMISISVSACAPFFRTFFSTSHSESADRSNALCTLGRRRLVNKHGACE